MELRTGRLSCGINVKNWNQLWTGNHLASTTYQNLFCGQFSSSNHVVMPKIAQGHWTLLIIFNKIQFPSLLPTNSPDLWFFFFFFSQKWFSHEFHRHEPRSRKLPLLPQMWKFCDSHPTSTLVRTCPVMSSHYTTLTIISSQFVKECFPFTLAPYLWPLLPRNLWLQAQADTCSSVLLPVNTGYHTKYEKHVTPIDTIFKITHCRYPHWWHNTFLCVFHSDQWRTERTWLVILDCLAAKELSLRSWSRPMS